MAEMKPEEAAAAAVTVVLKAGFRGNFLDAEESMKCSSVLDHDKTPEVTVCDGGLLASMAQRRSCQYCSGDGAVPC